jgi:hypothetical protein
MYKGLVTALYLLNIIFQSFLNLLTPIGLGLLISYLLTAYAGAPSWIWAAFTVFGVFVGLFSMVKFILSAMSALDRLEKEQKSREGSKKSPAITQGVSKEKSKCEKGLSESDEK